MIKELNIDGFKNLTNESFDLKNLTVLTGLNSTGKSSVIQTLLLLSSVYTREKKSFIKEVVKSFDKFPAIRNKYKNARTITINAKNIDGQAYSISLTINGMNTINTDQTAGDLEYERNFYYLSANRVGQEELALYDENQRFGANGNYTFGYYEQHKDDMVCKNLIRETASFTLQTQLGYWLTHILSVKMDLKTEKITSSNVKVSFDADGITGLSPLNVGSGNSYLAKVLIMLLSAKAGDMVIVENPEVHLHPKAQAGLGDFFCFVARAGVQIIVETHSEHFINKLRYEIYQSRISPGEIVIYYKKDIQGRFDKIDINKNGHFVDGTGQIVDFPKGFFDSTLTELLEIS
jgi:predicted ATPase